MIIDKDMIFNEDTHRYYLTEEYVVNLGIDLNFVLIDDFDTNISTINKRKIKYACDMVYDFVEKNACDKLAAMYLFAENKSLHNALKDAFEYQLYYFALNGDVSNDVGNKQRLVVSERAIQRLEGAGAFNVEMDLCDLPEGWRC